MARFICDAYYIPCAVEIAGRAYSLEELEALVRAHSSDNGATVCGNGAHVPSGAFCEVSDCGEKRSGLSRYCKKHDMRFRRHGDPTIALKAWDRKKGKSI